LNGINSIRFDVNTARYTDASPRKKILPVGELKSATETDKKKQFIKQLDNNLDSNQKQSNATSELLLSDGKYYRANLLNEIVNKMSGIEPRHYPGHLVEYYA
jgi:hypothetical protein